MEISNFAVKQARVKYDKVSPGQFSDEVVLSISSHTGVIVGIFPKAVINSSSGTVDAYVVNEQSGLFLVELPVQTFTTGSKVWFSKESVEVQPA